MFVSVQDIQPIYFTKEQTDIYIAATHDFDEGILTFKPRLWVSPFNQQDHQCTIDTLLPVFMAPTEHDLPHYSNKTNIAVYGIPNGLGGDKKHGYYLVHISDMNTDNKKEPMVFVCFFGQTLSNFCECDTHTGFIQNSEDGKFKNSEYYFQQIKAAIISAIAPDQFLENFKLTAYSTSGDDSKKATSAKSMPNVPADAMQKWNECSTGAMLSIFLAKCCNPDLHQVLLNTQLFATQHLKVPKQNVHWFEICPFGDGVWGAKPDFVMDADNNKLPMVQAVLNAIITKNFDVSGDSTTSEAFPGTNKMGMVIKTALNLLEDKETGHIIQNLEQVRDIVADINKQYPLIILNAPEAMMEEDEQQSKKMKV